MTCAGASHESGPAWLARPSPYETFIHNTSSILTGGQEKGI